MFLFQIYYTKRKRRIPIESNTKIAGEGCEVNFYRSLIRRGTEFQTLSITEHWHNELGNYYRFGCPGVVSYRNSDGYVWEETWYVDGRREVLIAYDKNGNGMFWPNTHKDIETYYERPNILFYGGEICKTNMFLVCRP